MTSAKVNDCELGRSRQITTLYLLHALNVAETELRTETVFGYRCRMSKSPIEHLVTSVIGAYVSYNSVPASELPDLIGSVHSALQRLNDSSEHIAAEEFKTAVPVKKSLFNDHVVCLVCGAKQKTLRRHLFAAHKLTPDSYRARYALPLSYPLVAPDYAAQRSQMAKLSGLGAKLRKPEPGIAKATQAGRKRSTNTEKV